MPTFRGKQNYLIGRKVCSVLIFVVGSLTLGSFERYGFLWVLDTPDPLVGHLYDISPKETDFRDRLEILRDQN